MTDASPIERAAAGDTRAIGRLLSAIEDRTPEGREAFSVLFARQVPTSRSTGVTGAPGAGKSTLVSSLIPHLRVDGERLAVVAVDPSSPFTGGAILGDRIRMADHAASDDVFIRSLANRGALGGISESTPAVMAALSGLGFTEVVVETVGIGQSEVEVATTADTTVVVVHAGWGDAIQASKAGFLEIGDVFVVNKADLPDAEGAIRDLEAMIALGPTQAWTPPVVATIATDGTGVGAVAEAVAAHREHLASSGEGDRRRRRRASRQLAAAVRQAVEGAIATGEQAPELVDRIAAFAIDPWAAADALLSRG